MRNFNRHRFLRHLLLRIFRVNVVGNTDHADWLAEGGRVLTCNHVSYLDGIMIALASPVPLVVPVDRDFSQRNAASRRLLKALETLGLGEVIPMDHQQSFGLRTLRKRLQSGASVLIFPEGRISVDGLPQEVRPGYRWLIDNTGAETLQLSIAGAHESRLFGKKGAKWRPQITLTFGPLAK